MTRATVHAYATATRANRLGSNWVRITIVALLAFVSLNAVAAGYGFIMTPDGSALGIPQSWLEDSPFQDYRIPGAVLLGVGLLLAFAAIQEARRSPWAWFWSGLCAGALIVWIVAQVWWMGYDRHIVQTTLQATVLSVGVAVGLLAFWQFRTWHQQWGALPAEIQMALPGDHVFPRPGFHPTRAVTIAASPEQVWPWLVQMGRGRGGFYSYDWLDNGGHRSLRRIDPALQGLKVGDWVPMAKKVNKTVAFRVGEMRAPLEMVWQKPDSTWAWKLVPQSDGATRLITRIRLVYDWRSPLVAVTLFLMEIADFFMMRKCLLGIKRRAETAAHEPQIGPKPASLN